MNRMIVSILAMSLFLSGASQAHAQIKSAKKPAIDDATAVAMAKPKELIVASDRAAKARAALLKPVDAFYGFWINGSPALLGAALSPRFIDHTLPSGRPPRRRHSSPRCRTSK